ncbi:MAG: MgtC/SapB family protein [Porticoccaceae bacterium]
MIPSYPLLVAHFTNIAIALAIGLLVGSERGWMVRARQEGARVAGIRTFALIALLGGVIAAATGTMADFDRWLICALIFLPVVAVLTSGYILSARQDGNISITTQVAAMLVYWLGVLPAFGLALPAIACAVVIALVLHLKDSLHRWLQVVDEAELLGTLQFLLASVVLLPLLPNRGFGPWQSFNPYHLWWMVVLISGLSLVGYFAMRIVGSRKGIVATSLTGGLVSSTAVTMSLSRLYREVGNSQIVAAGILLACSTMFARILLVVAIINKTLVPALVLPLGSGTLALLAVAWWLWRNGITVADGNRPEIRNPFQLIPALQFAGLLAVVMFAAEALQQGFGESGLYLLSVFTGLADVDAIVLSLAPKGGESLGASVVILCISLAAATNTLMKGIYCRVIAGPELGWKVLWPAAATAVLVLAVAAFSLVAGS